MRLIWPTGLERYNIVFLQFSAYEVVRGLSNENKIIANTNQANGTSPSNLNIFVNDFSNIPVTKIYLPVTRSIPMDLSLSYSEPTSVAEDFKELSELISRNIVKSATKMASTATQKFTGVDTSASIRNARKWDIAPSLSQVFEGVQFRKFTFDFDLIPSNKTEAQTIVKIIHEFTKYSLPSIEETTRTMQFPARWDIKIMKSVSDAIEITNEVGEIKRVDKIDSLMSFNRLVLTGIKTNFGDDNYYFYEDGTPNKITITLQFTETDYLTRNRYIENITRNII